MPWTRPDFKEITLSGEVTAYVNTDDQPAPFDPQRPRAEAADARGEEPQENSA